jgi:hypothetical protein
MILVQPGQNFVQDFEVFLVSVCVDQQVVNVHQHIVMLQSTPSMSLWKLAGLPSKPMGEVIQWNCPLPGIVKAVSFCEASSSCICQNPEVRSSMVKMVEFALLMWLIHSVISFMEYFLMCKFWFSSRKS